VNNHKIAEGQAVDNHSYLATEEGKGRNLVV
jgi:hypothetical protein